MNIAKIYENRLLQRIVCLVMEREHKKVSNCAFRSQQIDEASWP
jgi:hypothetical protein